MILSIVGISAACLTAFSFIPQIVKAVQTRSVKDVSIIMLSQLSFGVALWIIYGAYRKDLIVVLANSITLVSLSILLLLYYFYGRKK